MKARVFVTLKPSVFDPQGHTITEALHQMGYGGVEDVRQGKYFELTLPTATKAQAATAIARQRLPITAPIRLWKRHRIQAKWVSGFAVRS